MTLKQRVGQSWLLLNSELSTQGSHRLEKHLNLKGFLEKSLKIKSALKSTGKYTQKNNWRIFGFSPISNIQYNKNLTNYARIS